MLDMCRILRISAVLIHKIKYLLGKISFVFDHKPIEILWIRVGFKGQDLVFQISVLHQIVSRIQDSSSHSADHPQGE